MTSRLINTLVFSVFLSLLIGTKPSTNGLKQGNFSPYIEEFIQNLHRFDKDNLITDVKNLEVLFADDLEVGVIGACYFLMNRVEISRQYWMQAPIHERDELIQHELGHCILGLDHSKAPSIMQAGGVLGRVYKANYSALMNRHFGCPTGDCIKLTWDEERYK